MHCDMLKIQDGGAIVEKLNNDVMETPDIILHRAAQILLVALPAFVHKNSSSLWRP